MSSKRHHILFKMLSNSWRSYFRIVDSICLLFIPTYPFTWFSGHFYTNMYTWIWWQHVLNYWTALIVWKYTRIGFHFISTTKGCCHVQKGQKLSFLLSFPFSVSSVLYVDVCKFSFWAWYTFNEFHPMYFRNQLTTLWAIWKKYF